MAIGFRDIGSWLRKWFGTATYEAPVVVAEVFGPTKFRELSGETVFAVADDGTKFREVSGRTIFDVE